MNYTVKRKLFGFILSVSMLSTLMPGTGIMSYAQETIVTDDSIQDTLTQYEITEVNPEGTEDGWIYEDKGDGTLRITGYEGTVKDLLVPARIGESEVTEIGDGALAGKQGLSSVTVSEGITTIGEEAFADCPKLKTVELPDTVTNIGRRAFRYCFALSSCVLPRNLQEIPYQCFWECRNLSEITIPDGVVTIPNGTFYNNWNLKKVTVPDTVTTIEKNAFHACLILCELRLSENVVTIDQDAFSDCTMLVITAPEGSYADTFAKENGYVPETVILESEHPYPHEYQQWSYTHPEDAAALKVTFSPLTRFDSWDRFTITDGENIDYVYSGEKLTGETLVLAGNSFTMMLKAYGDKDYFGFRITDIEPMTAEEYQAYLDDINANPWLTRIVNGTLEITGYRGKMTDVVIPAKINGLAVAAIENSAFLNNNILQKVTIEEGVRSIRYNAFRRCRNLEEVIIPDSVTEIGGYAFSECTKLEKITLPKENVILGESMFDCCESLEELVLPEGLSVVKFGLCSGCTSLRSVVLPDSLKEINEIAFNKCAALEGLVLPEGLEAINKRAFNRSGLVSLMIPSTVHTIGEEIFADCANLTELMVENGNPYYSSRDNIIYDKTGEKLICSAPGLSGVITVPDGVKEIGYAAFYNDEKITKVILPDSLTDLSDSAFMGCKSLEEIVLPETITVLPEYIFSVCISLKEVRLPASVTEIQEDAFGGCENLKRVYIPDSVTFMHKYSFENSDSVVIYASADSYPFLFAQEHGMKALDAPLAREGLYADGTPKELITAGRATGGRLVYALGTGTDTPSEVSEYSEAIPTATDPGTYYVWYKIIGEGDSGDSEEDVMVSVIRDRGDVPDEDIPKSGIIPDGIWIAGVKDLDYTGKALTQEFRLYDGNRRLLEKNDYTVTYKNNTKAYKVSEQTVADPGNPTADDEKSAPSVIIGMKGNYGEVKPVYFSINAIDISTEEFSVSDMSAVYNGKKQTPAPVLTWKGKKLTAGTDFTVKEYIEKKDDRNAFKGQDDRTT